MTADPSSLFLLASVLTGCSLFSLGAFKAKFHDKQYFYSGFETLALGGACAAVAYYVGHAVAQYAGLEQMAFVKQYDMMLSNPR